jgi:hypothetical protein
MGFVAAARAVWTVCRDPVQTDRSLMLQVKNNFTADTAGLAYTISSTSKPPLPLAGEGWGEGSSAPCITWQTELVTTSAAEALEPDKNSRGPEAVEHNLACKWLREELADGPKSVNDIVDACLLGEFNVRTLRRALVTLGGQTRKSGFAGGWEWSLPDSPTTSPLDAESHSTTQDPKTLVPDPSPLPPPDNLSPSTETCPLRENTQTSESATCPLPTTSAEVAIPSPEELTLDEIRPPDLTPSPVPVTPIRPADPPPFAPILTSRDIDQFIRDLRRPNVHKSRSPGSAPSPVAELMVDILQKKWWPDEVGCRDP